MEVIVPSYCHNCAHSSTSAIRLNLELEPTCSSCQVPGFVELLRPSTTSSTAWLECRFGPSLMNGILNSNLLEGTSVRFHEDNSTTCSTGSSPATGSSNLTNNSAVPMSSFDSVLRYILEPLILGHMSFDAVIQRTMEIDTNNYGTPPGSAAVTAQLPSEEITEETATGDCPVCQEDFVVGDKVLRLSTDDSECSHRFHSGCILPWLQQHNSCPVCRFELPTDDEEYERRKREMRERMSN